MLLSSWFLECIQAYSLLLFCRHLSKYHYQHCWRRSSIWLFWLPLFLSLIWAVFFYTLASAPSRLMLVLFFCSRCTASFFGHILDEPLRFSRTTNTQVSSVLNMYRYKSRWNLLNKMHKIWLRTSCNGLLHSMLQNRLRVIRLWLIHELPLQSNIDHKQFFVECHIVSDADLSHRKVFILIKDTLANCV